MFFFRIVNYEKYTSNPLNTFCSVLGNLKRILKLKTVLSISVLPKVEVAKGKIYLMEIHITLAYVLQAANIIHRL